MFDEEDKPVVQGFQNLEKLSIEELEAYIRELDGEKERALAEIQKKKDVMDAANSIFK
tara:strand:+ start:226 stop:399 length:174 start_codon:yes stop_codon:yes gene_type:complete